MPFIIAGWLSRKIMLQKARGRAWIVPALFVKGLVYEKAVPWRVVTKASCFQHSDARSGNQQRPIRATKSLKSFQNSTFLRQARSMCRKPIIFTSIPRKFSNRARGNLALIWGAKRLLLFLRF